MDEPISVPETLPSVIEKTDASTNPLTLYLAGLAPSSRSSVVRSLRSVAQLLQVPYAAVPWAQLRYSHVVAIRQQLLARDLAPATVNLALAALRGIAREAWNLGLMSAEELARIRSVKGA